MNIAQSIISTPDRTAKERRDMAELRDIGPTLSGKLDWNGDCVICYFRDGSALMMTLDKDFSPTEFAVIDAPVQDAALAHAIDAISACEENGIEFDAETLSHNIESNFPELDLSECDEIAIAAMRRKN